MNPSKIVARKYRTFLKDYKVSNKGTKDEQVFIDEDSKNYYQKEYSQWLPLQNLKEKRSLETMRIL